MDVDVDPDKMESFPCPVCSHREHDQVFNLYEGQTVSSDHQVVKNTALDNRCCQDCGLVFNAQGVRGNVEEFYQDSYQLMTQESDAEIQNFSEGESVSQSLRSFQVLKEMCDLPESGRLLEIGSGKGEFLSHFSSDFSDWEITALEPSSSYEFLKAKEDGWNLKNCTYRDYPAKTGHYDVIVALGVLEHVEDPLDLMKWACQALRENGSFFIRIPNFENNPNDLLCVDHLSKFTVDTIQNLSLPTQFEIVNQKKLGVPVFISLTKSSKETKLESVYDRTSALCRKHTKFVNDSLDAVQECRRAAQKNQEKFGIFGMAMPSLFAPLYFNFDPREIAGYIDENENFWSRRVHDRPVGGLDFMVEQEIKHVALVISPVYIPQVKEKLEERGVSVYSPHVPDQYQ